MSFLRWLLGRLSKRKMDRFYARNEDPYRFRASRYDQERFHAMETALEGRRFRRVVEVGAGQGDFTERLALRAESLTAVEVSEVAVARGRARLPAAGVEWVCADARSWDPARHDADLVVLSEVLYYLDKPLSRGEFDRFFPRVASWLAPGGRLLLVHGSVTEEQRAVRRGYRERFESLGLTLVSERVVSIDSAEQPVSCLLSMMEKA